LWKERRESLAEAQRAPREGLRELSAASAALREIGIAACGMRNGFRAAGRCRSDSGPSGPTRGSRRLYKGTQTRQKTNLSRFFVSFFRLSRFFVSFFRPQRAGAKEDWRGGAASPFPPRPLTRTWAPRPGPSACCRSQLTGLESFVSSPVGDSCRVGGSHWRVSSRALVDGLVHRCVQLTYRRRHRAARCRPFDGVAQRTESNQEGLV